ncbi:MAG: tetratricopeptide repeat protein [Planctomycetes bacterium]|nr:tetratricopeptide repeat protein [Planctomycetota bacterium]
MKRFALVLAAVLVAGLSGCDEMKPTSLKERNKDTLDQWADTHVERLYQVCQQQYRAGQHIEVETKAQEALRLQPEHQEFLLMLGKVQIELGKPFKAEKALEKLAEIAPQRFDVPYFIGIARERSGNLQGALDSYQHALQLSGGRGSEIVMAATEVLISMGKPAEAQRFLQTHMPPPDEAEARVYELAGRLASILGQHSQAVDHFERATLMDVENLRYPEMLGEAQYHAGMFAEAISTFEGVLARDEAPDAGVCMMLGDCYLARGLNGKAIDAYRRACQADTGRVACWVNLAKGELASGNAERAAQAARQARKVDRRSVEAAQILAYALLKDNEVVQAAKVLKEARKTHPKDPTITCLLGQTYASVGKWDRAGQFYRYALKLDPKCAVARELLAVAEQNRTAGSDRTLPTP